MDIIDEFEKELKDMINEGLKDFPTEEVEEQNNNYNNLEILFKRELNSKKIINDEEYNNFEYINTTPKEKYILFILPENVESVSYISEIMMPYNEDIDTEYLIENVDNIYKEYEEDKDLYDDLHEFCMKNYCAYFNDDGKLVSKINENAFWEKYNIVSNVNINDVTVYFDSDGKIHKKQNYEADKWSIIINDIINNINSDLLIYASYY